MPTFTSTQSLQQSTDDHYTISDNLNILFIGRASFYIKNQGVPDGYEALAVNTIADAKNVLLECSFNKKEPLPEAIFCDVQINRQALSDFANYLSITQYLKHIPFILLAADNETMNLDFAIKYGVDDIINYTAPFSDLLYKIKLLSHYKSIRSGIVYKTPSVKSKIPVKHFSSFFRRLMDIIIASLLIILISPFLILISLAIIIDSKGSPFYISKRAGKGYKVFDFYKFRSMVTDADKKIDQVKHLNQYKDEKSSKKNVFIKIDKDPRITRLGKFLRKSSIDELPQLFNVLKGDMSIVGNRPLPLYEASALTTDEFAERFFAPAGMTGLWQTNGRGHESMSAEDRINMDITYAKKNSFFFDMYILLRTPKGIIQKADV